MLTGTIGADVKFGHLPTLDLRDVNLGGFLMAHLAAFAMHQPSLSTFPFSPAYTLSHPPLPDNARDWGAMKVLGKKECLHAMESSEGAKAQIQRSGYRTGLVFIRVYGRQIFLRIPAGGFYIILLD